MTQKLVGSQHFRTEEKRVGYSVVKAETNKINFQRKITSEVRSAAIELGCDLRALLIRQASEHI